MRDELALIDVVERIKAWLLSERPPLDEACARRSESFQAEHPIRFYKERFLAALTGADPTAPGQLRELSRAVRLAEEEPEEFRRELIGEETPPFYARLGQGKRKSLLRSLGAFAAFGDDPREAGRALGERLRACGRLDEARVLVHEAFPALKGLDLYRVLKAWDYPLLLPDARRHVLFFRLGAVAEQKYSEREARPLTELGESIHRLTGEPLQALDLLFGAFTGAEPGQPRSLARCLPKPLCDRCPVSSQCEYFKYRRDPAAAPKRATIKDWDPRQRPRERLMRHGAAQLNDAELLAILLRTGTSKATALELAHQLLRRFEGVTGIDEAALAELCDERGMGEVKAATLKAALELGKRLLHDTGPAQEFIHSSYDVFYHFENRFLNLKMEQFYLLCLNTKHAVIHEALVSQGSLASNLVHPREAFKEAIRHSAAAVIFVHNHPSGDPTPSDRDRELTHRLRESSQILGIPLLDHVVMGRNKYYSFQDDKMFDFSDAGNDDAEQIEGADKDTGD
ncbi:MAG: DNA repair protein RadC [Candidatus Sumerlaeota bacterium]|nr:DNA repair protein RadC [Candidatus Sumerlaeota bacterium]